MTTTDTTSPVAETLQAAAEWLRERAGEASEGPWGWSRWPGSDACAFGRNDPATGQAVTTIAAVYNTGADGPKHAGNAAYCAAMNPHDVGLPLADLLAGLAEMHRERGTQEWPSEALRRVAEGVLASKGKMES